MAGMIKVTDRDRKEMWINIDHIVRFRAFAEGAFSGSCIILDELCNGVHSSGFVLETPEEVLALCHPARVYNAQLVAHVSWLRAALRGISQCTDLDACAMLAARALRVSIPGEVTDG